ncbi:ribosomal protein S18 acetylase RimI-like enzyme [Beijerinckia sp. GAS462]|nr:ribosomal protein S18 acetylase RimI-like enzyme [Beijerinckia sp. GAS462]SED06743.1 Ribosomal protein S18 acetylase RimI [Beijerinckia sp. 28-YEA-48]
MSAFRTSLRRMQQALLSVRSAKADDIAGLADVYAAAWVHAYRGIIPGRELDRMVRHRGARWWRAAMQRGSGLLVADFEDSVAGYVSYGRNRDASARYSGEIYELYLLPEFQGLGFGRRLFRTAQDDLARRGYASLVVWALAENELATGFYEAMGGKVSGKALEYFGAKVCERVAFKFER